MWAKFPRRQEKFILGKTLGPNLINKVSSNVNSNYNLYSSFDIVGPVHEENNGKSKVDEVNHNSFTLGD